MDIETSLEQFGLDNKRAKVYLASLELGTAKANEIAKKTGLERPTVYDILEKLIAERLVAMYEKRGVRYYVAEDPEKFKVLLQEKERSFDSLLPNLKSLYNTLKSKPKIKFYEGIGGIKTIFEDTITATDKNLRGILSMVDLYKIPGKTYMDDYVARRVALGYKLRVIRSQPKEVEEIWPASIEEQRQLRYAPVNNIFDMTTYIYDNKVGLISSRKENFGMIIESDEFSRTMGFMFEALWQISTKV